jgi:hypothetical protein
MWWLGCTLCVGVASSSACCIARLDGWVISLVVFASQEAMSHLMRASVRQALSSAVLFVCMLMLHSELLSELGWSYACSCSCMSEWQKSTCSMPRPICSHSPQLDLGKLPAEQQSSGIHKLRLQHGSQWAELVGTQKLYAFACRTYGLFTKALSRPINTKAVCSETRVGAFLVFCSSTSTVVPGVTQVLILAPHPGSRAG